MLVAVDETPVSLSARLLNANAQLQSVTLTYSALTGKLSGDLSGLASGTYTLELTPRDSAGNVGSVFSQSLSVDQLAPVLSLGALADNQLSGAELANFSQALVLDDVSASVLVSLRNAAGTEQNTGLLSYADGVVSGNLSSLADGSYQLSVQARDPSGNLGEPALQTLVLDTSAPVLGLPAAAVLLPSGFINKALVERGLVITGSAAGAENGQLVAITLSGSGASPALSLSASVNDGVFSVTLSSVQLATLTEGEHLLSAQVEDRAGNLSQLATLALKIDTLAPSAPGALTLAAASDTGQYSNDNVTRLSQGLQLSGQTVSADVGA